MPLHLRPLPPETAEIRRLHLKRHMPDLADSQLDNMVEALAVQVGPEQARYLFLEAALAAIVRQARASGKLTAFRFAAQVFLDQEFEDAVAGAARAPGGAA